MEMQEMVFVGIVMGWEPNSMYSPSETVNAASQVVTEFCPGGSISGGRIKPNARMRDLALAGYLPVGMVYRDRSNPAIHYLCEHDEVSDAVHQQLLEDAEAICGAAAGIHTRTTPRWEA